MSTKWNKNNASQLLHVICDLLRPEDATRTRHQKDGSSCRIAIGRITSALSGDASMTSTEMIGHLQRLFPHWTPADKMGKVTEQTKLLRG